MPLPKPKESLKVAILVPCYKRAEYTELCIRYLEDAQIYKNTTFYLIDDGSGDEKTKMILTDTKLDSVLVIHDKNEGLRKTLIEFIEWARENEYDMMGVMGNDCLVPENWLNTLIDIMDTCDMDILSPNVFPSNPAFKMGIEVPDDPRFRPSKIVGGLWFMAVSLTDGIVFDKHDVRGITGAFNILKQILIEKEPGVAWAAEVVVQDLGHWSGRHPWNIKNDEHRKYYEEVGRGTSW